MGIQVEFNPDLALRNIAEQKAGRRSDGECIPENLQLGQTYPFLKKGQRLYWLQGELPLVETQGLGNLSRPLASITIDSCTHFLHENEVWTKGSYTVREIFEDGQAHFDGFTKL